MIADNKDPMGAAIYDYFRFGKAGRLRVFSSQFDEDEIPVETLFVCMKICPLRNRPHCSWLKVVY